MEEIQAMQKIKPRPKDMKSISHALSVLDDAARDSSTEIKQMIKADYNRLQKTFAELSPELKGALWDMKEASVESIGKAKDKVVQSTKETVEKVDQKAHQNPWYFIGGSALLAGVFGFLFGRKSKS